MRQLLCASAAIALLAGPALAQAETEAEPEVGSDAQATDTETNAEPAAPAAEPGPALGSNEAEPADRDGERNGYSDEHPWVDAAVYSEGRQIGAIERVHFLRDEVDTVVIETGEGAEVEGREIEVTENDVEQIARDDGSVGFMLKMAMADFESLPAFGEGRRDYRQSAEPADGEEEDADAEDAAASDEDAEETG